MGCVNFKRPIKYEFQQKAEKVVPLKPVESSLECVDPKNYISTSFLNWNNLWERRWNECSIFLIKTNPPPPPAVVQEEEQEEEKNSSMCMCV